MKELSIEEKAKAYDKVREKIEIRFGSNVADEIFSQFEMSEDEKIRKAIKKALQVRCDGSRIISDEPVTLEEAIAWLERQGKNSMGISEATKQELEDSLNKALEKETPESFNKFLDEQKPAEWSEKESSLCTQIQGILSVCRCYNLLSPDLYKKMCDWLKSLKDRVQPQPKQEWSEEDKKMSRFIGNAITADDSSMYLESKGIQVIDAHAWLDELKDRYTWKPSDEQMKALNNINITGCISYAGQGQVLIELYNDLKKLIE